MVECEKYASFTLQHIQGQRDQKLTRSEQGKLCFLSVTALVLHLRMKQWRIEFWQIIIDRFTVLVSSFQADLHLLSSGRLSMAHQQGSSKH